MSDDGTKQGRGFLKDSVRQQVDFGSTDQQRGVPVPPPQKPCPEGALRVPLTPPDELGEVGRYDLREAIAGRESRRRFAPLPISVPELSFLLWATQGVRERLRPAAILRTVPSAGARHSFETYLAVRRVEGLAEGLYRYQPLEHELVFLRQVPDLSGRLAEACLGQTFAGRGAVTFLWTTIPYRMEWRYGPASHKVIAVDVGHVCQNLYLACEAIGAGTCAIGAYDQDAADDLLGVDGTDEFTIYIAPVGKKRTD